MNVKQKRSGDFPVKQKLWENIANHPKWTTCQEKTDSLYRGWLRSKITHCGDLGFLDPIPPTVYSLNKATWHWREPTCLFFYINSGLDLWPWPWPLLTFGLDRDVNYYPVWILVQSIQTNGGTDRKWCIWAHRAKDAGGLKKIRGNSDKKNMIRCLRGLKRAKLQGNHWTVAISLTVRLRLIFQYRHHECKFQPWSHHTKGNGEGVRVLLSDLHLMHWSQAWATWAQKSLKSWKKLNKTPLSV